MDCLVSGRRADHDRDTAIVNAICAEFLESRFLRRDWPQGSRRTLDAGAKIRAAGRRQSHADGRAGVGSHDDADYVARVVENHLYDYWLKDCIPKYLAETMTLGEVVQASAAFVVVQGAFGWFTDNYARLAEWASSANRVASLLLALDEVDLSDARYSRNAAKLAKTDSMF